MSVRISLAVLACALATFLAGCEFEFSIGGSALDREDVENTLSEGLADRVPELPPPDVDCAGIEDIEVADGSDFECRGTGSNGEEFLIELTLTDDEGGFRWQVAPQRGSPTT